MAKDQETVDDPVDDSLFDASEYESLGGAATSDGFGDGVVDDVPAVDTAVVGVDEPAVGPSLAALLRQREFDLSDDVTDDDVISRFEELETTADAYERLKGQYEQLQHQLYQKQQPVEKPAESVLAKVEEEELIPSPPELDVASRAILEVAFTQGLVKEGPGGFLTTDDVSMRSRVDTYNEWVSKKREYDKEWGDPRKVAERVIESRLVKEREALRQEILEEIRKDQTQQNQRGYLDQYGVQNAQWLYGADGASFTHAGAVFDAALSYYLRHGHEPQKAVRLAQYDTKETTGQAPWESSAKDAVVPDEPAPTPQSKKNILRRKAKTNGHNRLNQAPVTPRRAAPSHVPSGAVSPRELQRSWEREIYQALGETD